MNKFPSSFFFKKKENFSRFVNLKLCSFVSSKCNVLASHMVVSKVTTKCFKCCASEL